jgi:hypothetical protein
MAAKFKKKTAEKRSYRKNEDVLKVNFDSFSMKVRELIERVQNIKLYGKS